MSEHGHNEDSYVVALPQCLSENGQIISPVPNSGQNFSHAGSVPFAPANYALLQSIDIIAPLGSDPRLFGQCAAANALSDIYAMGGQPYTAMNVLSFSSCDTPLEVVQEILQGALDKITEAGAVACGGHTLESKELRFGLSVTGLVDKTHFSQNKNLRAGDVLILTKPLGTGVLSTGIRGKWDFHEEAEQILFRHTTRLNKVGAELIRRFKIQCATDITGFGLIGHCLETAKASNKHIVLWADKIPFMEYVLHYAKNGLIPKRCYDNQTFASRYIDVQKGVSPLLATLCHDPQTSGGLVLAVRERDVQAVCTALTDNGDHAFLIGEVTERTDSAQKLLTPNSYLTLTE